MFAETRALKVIPIPIMMIAVALTAGRIFSNRLPLRAFVINPVDFTIRIPIIINTEASPRLKEKIRPSPRRIRCMEIAASSITRADGQGTIPPEIPSAIRLERLTPPSGR